MKKFLIALALLLSLLPASVPTSAQFDSCLPGVCGGAPPTGCTSSASFLARTSGLDAPHRANYTNLICGLVADGIWTKFDVLHIYATQDTTTAQLNLVQGSYPATLHGSPTFTADRGYTGVGGSTTVYIDTGFNPSTAGGVYVLNSGHLSYWSLTNAQATANIGAIVGAASTLVTGAFTDNFFYARINSASGIAGNVANTIGNGHFIGSRTASNLTDGYRNGSSLALNSNQASTSIPNDILYSIGVNNGGTPLGVGQQYTMTSIGSGLSAGEVTLFYNRLRTYMTAVGVP